MALDYCLPSDHTQREDCLLPDWSRPDHGGLWYPKQQKEKLWRRGWLLMIQCIRLPWLLWRPRDIHEGTAHVYTPLVLSGPLRMGIHRCSASTYGFPAIRPRAPPRGLLSISNTGWLMSYEGRGGLGKYLSGSIDPGDNQQLAGPHGFGGGGKTGVCQG